MPIVYVPFDGWTPSGSYFGEGWQTVTNLYPAHNAWRPWRKWAAVGSGVVAGPVTGRHVHIWPSGVGGASYTPDAPTVFAGTTTSLYTVDTSTGAFTAIPRGAAYTANPAGWRFLSFGNDVWAFNGVDVPQRRTNNAGNFADGVTSTFVPVARFACAVREHMVVANLSNVGRFPDELVWSDADNAVNFDPAATTSTSLAGSKRLVSIAGQITGLVGGQYGLAFKRRGVYYLEYTGTSQVLRPEILSSHVGTAYPSSIINSRAGTFFRGPDGFYVIEGLSEPRKVSPLGVEWWFKNQGYETAYPTTAWGEDSLIVGFEHPSLPLVGWGLGSSPPLSGGSTENVGSLTALLYNYAADRWSVVDVDQAGNRLAAFVPIPGQPGLDGLAGISWGSNTSRYATLSTSSADARASVLELRYRPVNFDVDHQKQSKLLGVLPVFSKTSPSGTALTGSVTVTPLLDPFLSPGTAEPQAAAQRDPISGFYPFQRAGRFFQVRVSPVAEDFASFEGTWIRQELMT